MTIKLSLTVVIYVFATQTATTQTVTEIWMDGYLMRLKRDRETYFTIQRVILGISVLLIKEKTSEFTLVIRT